MSGLELDNAFWRFSLVVYAQPDVAPECIALQEAAGNDVNILLFSAWLGAEREAVLSGADLEDLSQRLARGRSKSCALFEGCGGTSRHSGTTGISVTKWSRSSLQASRSNRPYSTARRWIAGIEIAFASLKRACGPIYPGCSNALAPLPPANGRHGS